MIEGVNCWISGFVQLPNFYLPGASIKAHQITQTVDEDLLNSGYPEFTHLNRDMCNLHNLRKYKIEIFMLYPGSSYPTVAELVGVSDRDFNLMDVHSFLNSERGNQAFYPIYIKSENRTYLCMTSIKRFLAHNAKFLHFISSNLDDTASVMSAVELINEAMNYSSGTTKPDITPDLVPIERNDTAVELIFLGLTESQMDRLSGDYYVDPNTFPRPVMELCRAQFAWEIASLISPYGFEQSDVSLRCAQFVANTEEINRIRDELNSKGVIPNECADIYYSGDTELVVAGKWLSGIMSLPTSDFSMVLPDTDPVADMYIKGTNLGNNFTTFFDRVDIANKGRLCYLNSCFSLVNKYNLKNTLLQRTWLEDVIIRHPDTNDILLYIDLVPWVIACAEGIINRSILNNVKLY